MTTPNHKKFLKRALEKHGNKYDYSKVVYVNGKTPVIVGCPIHGELEQTPINHLQGSGCKLCGTELRNSATRKTQAQFLEEAIAVHGMKYNYSKVVYVNSITPVMIDCPIHGEFEQKPHSHISGSGCTLCGIETRNQANRKTQTQFLEEAFAIHGDVYDYSKVEYVNSNTPVTIICRIHKEFQQTPQSHLNGAGCIPCSTNRAAISRRITTDEFITRSKQIHGEKYDYSKTVYTTSHANVIITCMHMDHGDFMQTPHMHLQGNGCKKCGILDSGINRRLTTEEFIADAQSIHDELYDYSETVYVKTDEKVKIICKNHGAFYQTPHSHLNGAGCKLCYDARRSEELSYTTDDFIRIAQTVHSGVYDYSKTVYTRSTEEVSIICPIHGLFTQRAVNHLTGKGCIKCSNDNCSSRLSSNIDEFIQKATKIHNGKYDYSKSVYVASRVKIIICCLSHGEFLQTPNDHLTGYGCPKCTYRISKPSQEWLRMVQCTHSRLQTGEHEKGEFRIPATRYSADGYCPDTNTIFEFHGDYWHGNPKRYAPDMVNQTTKCTMGELYQRTLKKRATCEELGYRYVEIWESEWNTLKRVLRRRLRM